MTQIHSSQRDRNPPLSLWVPLVYSHPLWVTHVYFQPPWVTHLFLPSYGDAYILPTQSTCVKKKKERKTLKIDSLLEPLLQVYVAFSCQWFIGQSVFTSAADLYKVSLASRQLSRHKPPNPMLCQHCESKMGSSLWFQPHFAISHILPWIYGYVFSDIAHPLTFLAVDAFVRSCTMTLVSTDQVFTTSSKPTWRAGTLVDLCNDIESVRCKQLQICRIDTGKSVLALCTIFFPFLFYTKQKCVYLLGLDFLVIIYNLHHWLHSLRHIGMI